MKPTVTIITVCFNAAQCIIPTIESVLNQCSTDLEYLFIDGASTDATVEIIRSYEDAFRKKNIAYTLVSEPDKGIYDAMNKGAARAQGEYVLMLNAGDRLADERVLADVFSRPGETADVLYGDVILNDGPYYKTAKAQALESIVQDMPFSHQSVFVRTEVLRQYGFDTRYRLAADYNQLLRCFLDSRSFRYVDRIISVYDTCGVSEKNFHRTLREQRDIRNALGLKSTKSIAYTRFARMRARLIRRLAPEISRSEARGWYRSVQRAEQERENG